MTRPRAPFSGEKMVDVNADQVAQAVDAVINSQLAILRVNPDLAHVAEELHGDVWMATRARRDLLSAESAPNIRRELELIASGEFIPQLQGRLSLQNQQKVSAETWWLLLRADFTLNGNSAHQRRVQDLAREILVTDLPSRLKANEATHLAAVFLTRRVLQTLHSFENEIGIKISTYATPKSQSGIVKLLVALGAAAGLVLAPVTWKTMLVKVNATE